MGKMRRYRAYLSISASGPLLDEKTRSLVNSIHADMRPRALADLAYTTSDVDYFEKYWAAENYDTAPYEFPQRLKNPSINDFKKAIGEIRTWFSQFYNDENWDGGGITITYAGHGREADGALVLTDGDIDWKMLLDELLSIVQDNNEHRLRVDILLDSCYSGAFLTEIQHKMRSKYEEKLYPYYSAAACMFDEVSREYKSLGHGLFTYCFSIKSETPGSFYAKAIQPDNTFGPSLSLVEGPYGCSFVTQATQNPIIIDGDLMTLCGEYIDLYNEGHLIPLPELRSKMMEVRGNFKYLFGGFKFPNGMLYKSGELTNKDIREQLEKMRELYENKI
ncbi:hypothetical protein NBE98_17885 [Clostridium swellfunianum]|uniref:hypothetical protein n=1 Tax=Clostridium swellfunianum TaxID=1367462 RepID=UPI00202E77C2|nr:hypothetical protein [Clostridium swellfunianum]MCM0650239.1 hypothetical protein [Clostridium swellfunianum]